nr:MAG TPA: hypothetical protein [Caudoviricetes sp.]
MEKCGKKRKFMFSAKCQGLRKKTYLHVFCKIQIVENNMFFSFRNFAEKNVNLCFLPRRKKTLP